jgi:hypothetical protein
MDSQRTARDLAPAPGLASRLFDAILRAGVLAALCVWPFTAVSTSGVHLPAWVESLIFPIGLVGALVVCGWTVILVLATFLTMASDPRWSVARRLGRAFAWTLVPAVLAFTALFSTWPTSLALWFSESAFEELASEDPSTWPRGTGDPAEVRRLGLYAVDAVRRDDRGGLYYRTGWYSLRSPGPIVSYGFARTPNAEGTPFGARIFHLTPLDDTWSWFEVHGDG